MSMELLRLYPPSAAGPDGYPWAWAHETMCDDQSNRHPGDGPRLNPPIKDFIRDLAGDRCVRCGHPYIKGTHALEDGESWSRCDESCTHGQPFRYGRDIELNGWSRTLHDHTAGQLVLAGWTVEALWRVLTVHHLDEDKLNCRWWNLAALCQRCHLRMQRRVVMNRPWLYEHTDWFKPYAAGFYAWKYLDEDLTFVDTLKRMPELLALEHRFTQEVLL